MSVNTAATSKLFRALIEKTAAGKLTWQETADESTFLVSVSGDQTFTISSFVDGSIGLVARGRLGEIQFQLAERCSDAIELYSLAKEAASTRLAKQINSAVELINRL